MASGTIKQSYYGSNTKGKWYKFSDGWLLQWGINTYTSGSYSLYAGNIYTLLEYIDFPLQSNGFITAPELAGGFCRVGTGMGFPCGYLPYSSTATQGAYAVWDSVARTLNSTTYVLQLQWWALGRWV